MNVFGFEEREKMGHMNLKLAVNKTPTKDLYGIKKFQHAFEVSETANIVYMSVKSPISGGAHQDSYHQV